MSNNLPTNRSTSTWVYGAVAFSLLALGTGTAYYLVEDDKRVKRRKAGRRAERETLRVLNQYKEEAEKVASEMEAVESTIEDTSCDDKAFKKKEYTLAHSNELLLQLMEKMDAIRPLTAVIGTEAEPSAFERDLVANIKSKKRTVIEYIEALFRRLDTANSKAKTEAERREKVAEEKARLEKEEQERIAKEEQERIAKEEQERIAKEEQERIAKEEQEKIAQEEALRRKEEEEQRLVKEALDRELQKMEESTEEVSKETEQQQESIVKEEPILEQASAIEEAIVNSEAAAIQEAIVNEVAIATEEQAPTVAAVVVDEQSGKEAEKQAIAQEEAILAAMEEADQDNVESK